MTSTFISSPSARLPFRSFIRPKLCTAARRTAPIVAKSSFSAPNHAPQMKATPNANPSNDDEFMEDDDATMGGDPKQFGIQLYGMTRKQQEYLNSATSEKEMRKRLASIAREKEVERKAQNLKRGIQGADDYMAGLSRRREPAKDTPARTEVAEDSVEDLKVVENEQEPPAKPVKVEPTPVIAEEEGEGVTEDDVEDDAGDVEGQIAELEAQLREMGGESAPVEVEAESESKVDGNVVDKQIAFLEEYLAKLEREQEVEKKGSEENTAQFESAMKTLEEYVSKPFEEEKKTEEEFGGLEDTPGGMSAEEKKQAFMAIREQALGERADSPFMDPLAGPLADRKDEIEEVGADGGVVNNSSIGDVIDEIEVEVREYLKEQKKVLELHEIRLQGLLTKLKEY